MTINDIITVTNAKLLDNTINQQTPIDNLQTLTNAKEQDISFFHNTKYYKELANTKAKVVLIEQAYVNELPKNCIALISDKPYIAMAKLTKVYADKKQIPTTSSITDKTDIANNVHIGKGSVVGIGTTIMPGAYIGHNVHIGKNCIIHPNVVIYDDTIIGNETIIHANSTIGSDGFGYVEHEGKPLKLYHLGSVHIGNFVEIGANVAIDRALLGATTIDDYCKFDNLIQVGHNCSFGKYTAVTALCGFAGSTHIGNKVMIYGNSGFAGHLSVCDEAVIMAKSGVTKSITQKGLYSGVPIQPHTEWIKSKALLKRLLKKSPYY